jgi:hypothetical protein
VSTAGVRGFGPFPDLALADPDGRRALDLGVVPVLVPVDRAGRIERVSPGFRPG